MSLETNSSLDPLEKNTPGQHLDFGLVKPGAQKLAQPTLTSDLPNCEIINEGFKFGVTQSRNRKPLHSHFADEVRKLQELVQGSQLANAE